MIIEKKPIEFLSQALRNLSPQGNFVIRGGETYAHVEWIETDNPPSKSVVDAEVNRLKLEWVNTEYQRLRAAEYPSIQQQLDMQYWDSVNGTTTWQDAINAVKAKYPKPE